MAETESLFGKTADAFRAWFRTFALVIRDRRALLTSAPDRPDPPMAPIAFMLAGAAAAYAVQGFVAFKAPAMELPGPVSAAEQAVSFLGGLTAVLTVASALMSAGSIWVAFRLFRVTLGWSVVLRHTAYNSGAQSAALVFLAVPELIWRVTLHPAGPVVAGVSLLGWLISYVLLLGWMFRQLREECGVRRWRALTPLAISVLPLWAVAAILFDSGPEIWVTGVYWMEPGIVPDDPVHVDRWILAARDPIPGEVVTLAAPDAGAPLPPMGGAYRTMILPITRRVVAVPGDMVSQSGAELFVNGDKLPRDPVKTRPHDSSAEGLRFRQQIGERRFLTMYGPMQAPKPCVPETPVELPPDVFLVAQDRRPDDVLFCGIVRRSSLRGLIDWNVRSKAAP